MTVTQQLKKAEEKAESHKSRVDRVLGKMTSRELLWIVFGAFAGNILKIGVNMISEDIHTSSLVSFGISWLSVFMALFCITLLDRERIEAKHRIDLNKDLILSKAMANVALSYSVTELNHKMLKTVGLEEEEIAVTVPKVVIDTVSLLDDDNASVMEKARSLMKSS